MPTTFVVGDLHFGHKGVTHFVREDGSKLRPWDNTNDMDKALIDFWNETVTKEDDLVYVLGDFCLNRRYIANIAPRLRGRKILVKGNHDTGRLSDYIPFFEDIVACKVMHKAILTHIPVHPAQLGRFGHNIHGHLHSNVVGKEFYMAHGAYKFVPDERYTCVSVEHTDWRPVPLDSILEKL
jgi:calcineurin-like phosphoesterase family protein